MAVTSGDAVVTTGLTRTFGSVTAVDDVSLTIRRGSVFGLLGPDGAGKSTLLRMLATVLAPDAGDAAVFGASVTREATAVTPRIGYMSQQFCMYPDLTVTENLEFFATLRGVGKADRRDRADRLLTAMGMAAFTGRQSGRLSGGMKQKLMLASTLMHEPELLLLDEPTTGVDPVSRREFWSILAQLQEGGTTVLVATPYMDEASRCTDIAFLDAGRITRSGTPAELTAAIPGTVLEVAAAQPRVALAVLTEVASAPASAGTSETAPGDAAPASPVRSAHLLGDRVRVLSPATGPGAEDAVRRVLADAGIDAQVTAIEPDMEDAFAYLAQAAS